MKLEHPHAIISAKIDTISQSHGSRYNAFLITTYMLFRALMLQSTMARDPLIVLDTLLSSLRTEFEKQHIFGLDFSDINLPSASTFHAITKSGHCQSRKTFSSVGAEFLASSYVPDLFAHSCDAIKTIHQHKDKNLFELVINSHGIS